MPKQPAKKPSFNPNRLTLDDGRGFDTNFGEPALFNVGTEQIRQRRAAEDRYESEQRTGPFASPLWKVGGRLAGGPAPDLYNDAFYGLLQAKENTANASGMRLKVNPNASNLIPSTAIGDDQQALPASLAGLSSLVGDSDFAINRRKLGQVKATGQSKLRVQGQRGGPAER